MDGKVESQSCMSLKKNPKGVFFRVFFGSPVYRKHPINSRPFSELVHFWTHMLLSWRAGPMNSVPYVHDFKFSGLAHKLFFIFCMMLVHNAYRVTKPDF